MNLPCDSGMLCPHDKDGDFNVALIVYGGPSQDSDRVSYSYDRELQ